MDNKKINQFIKMWKRTDKVVVVEEHGTAYYMNEGEFCCAVISNDDEICVDIEEARDFCVANNTDTSRLWHEFTSDVEYTK